MGIIKLIWKRKFNMYCSLHSVQACIFLVVLHKLIMYFLQIQVKLIVPKYIPTLTLEGNRIDPWEYDKELYKKRNEIKRFFCRYKRFRRICTCYDKLDYMFVMFFFVGLIYELLR